MNKAQLVNEIAKSTKVTKTSAEAMLNAFCTTVQASVGKGRSVSLVGFGSFVSKNRKARTCRNPQTGEKLKIKAKKVPAFRPGKNFKKAVSK